MFFIFKKSYYAILSGVFLTVLTACGGGSAESNTSLQISHHQGVVQKGPFAMNSFITITPLDLLGIPSQSSLQIKTIDKKGTYEFDEPKGWKAMDPPLYEILGDGRYFDESSGLTTHKSLQLRAITTDLNLNSVNVLTHWLAARTKVLLQQGKSPIQSIQQSKEELTMLFGINHAFELNMAQSSKHSSDNAMLLLLSGALMDVAELYTASPQEIIDDIALDFSRDGKLTEKGRSWSKRIQSKVMHQTSAKTNRYSSHLKRFMESSRITDGNHLPAIIPFASRPSAVISTEINGRPNETIFLDATGSTDPDNDRLRFTWFRIDQEPVNILFKDAHDNEGKFIAKPSITLPSQEVDLLFAVVVTDTNNLSDTAITKVIVKNATPTNHAPVAAAQTVTTLEDYSIDFTLAGTDPDGDTISNYIIANTPMLLNHGSVEINGSLPNLRYIPQADANGTDSFTFQVSDGDKTSVPATVTINITPVNDKPIAISQDNVMTNEDHAVNITLAGSDVDGDTLTYTYDDSLLKYGTLSINGALPSLIYTPFNNAYGTDRFTFNVSDGIETSDSAAVTIPIASIDDGDPIASFFVAFYSDQNTPINTDNPILQGIPLHFDGSGSSDPDDFTLADGSSYEDIVSYTWTITENDGTVKNRTGSTIDYVPQVPGNLTISLTVTDRIGAVNTTSKLLYIEFDEGNIQ